MSEQPEALRLADYLTDRNRLDLTCDEAAAELRRLHAKCEALRADAQRWIAIANTWAQEVKTEQRLSFRDQLNKAQALNAELVEALELMRERFLDTEGRYGQWEQEATDAADSVLAKAKGQRRAEAQHDPR